MLCIIFEQALSLPRFSNLPPHRIGVFGEVAQNSFPYPRLTGPLSLRVSVLCIVAKDAFTLARFSYYFAIGVRLFNAITE